MMEPLIEFEDRNGKIQLYKNFVRLDRRTTLSLPAQGSKRKKDIYLDNIASVHVKKPGWVAGYIWFTLSGGIESTVRGPLIIQKGENTFTFYERSNYKKALRIRKHIRDKRRY